MQGLGTKLEWKMSDKKFGANKTEWQAKTSKIGVK